MIHIANGSIPDFENKQITFKHIIFSKKIRDYLNADTLTKKAWENIRDGNYKTSLGDLFAARELGNGDAVCLIGWLMEHGLGVPKDSERAKQLYAEGELLGAQIWQIFGVACASATLGADVDYKKAVYWMEKDANLTADN